MIIEFDTNNSAFEDHNEPARILRDIADRVALGQTNGTVRDYNGNRVGYWTLNPDEDGALT